MSHYSNEYFQKQNYFPGHFSHTILLLCQELGVKNILDVGCGTGLLIQFLNEHGFQAVGCDSSQAALKIARLRNKPDQLIKASATKLPFKNSSFDLVTAIALIEHLTLKEGQQFIKEAHRVLKKGSYFFLGTPNLLSPRRLLKGRNWFAYSDPTHITFYHPLSLSCLLKQAGFTQFHFWFKIPKDLPFDWWFEKQVAKLPKAGKQLISFLLISSPLSLIRESFYLCCQKL